MTEKMLFFLSLADEVLVGNSILQNITKVFTLFMAYILVIIEHLVAFEQWKYVFVIMFKTRQSIVLTTTQDQFKNIYE